MVALRCAAVLCDLDGTLVDSGDSVVRAWTRFAHEVGREPEQILAMCHGVRTTEVIEALNLDGSVMDRALRVESWIVADGAQPTAGAADFLTSLPAHRWAVVTSSLRPTAMSRFEGTELPAPEVAITAEDVVNGKPDPSCYLAGAAALGVEPHDCVVIEDAPAGVAAGKAAGMRVIAVTTTHPAEELAAADLIIDSLALLTVRTVGDEVVLET